jgi:hypothetical protein
MFSITSRYQGLPTAVHRLADGREVVFVRRRFLPHPEDLVPTGEYVVLPGDRLDRVADKVLGDPEQAWQIADANRAMDPDELVTEPGRRLRIAQATAAKGGFPLAVPGTGGFPLALPGDPRG